MSPGESPEDGEGQRDRFDAVERGLKAALERREAQAQRAEQRERQAQASRSGGSAWRMVSNLVLATVLVSLAGYGVDALLDTSPFGLLGGLFLGFAAGLWMAARSAAAMQRAAQDRDEPGQGGPGS